MTRPAKVIDIREARQRKKPITYPCIFPFAMKNPFVTERAELLLGGCHGGGMSGRSHEQE